MSRKNETAPETFEPSNERYSRQERFRPIGNDGQKQLRQKHVLIVGAGALGSASAECMVRAGIGKLTIVDRDYVEWSNLQRQQLYTEKDVRERLPKVIAAKRHLEAINAEVQIEARVWDVRGRELTELVEGVDLILDACDNFHTRFIINDVAQKYQIPWVYAACVGSYGISCTIVPGETPCLSCMMDLIPGNGESCDIDGIIAPAVQMVVSHQTAEALKILTGNMEALHRKLVSFDLWSNQFTRINIHSMKKEHCSSCSCEAAHPFLQNSKDTENEKAAALCGRDTVHIRPNVAMSISIEELAASLDKQEIYQIETMNSFLLSANVNALRIVLFNDGRALVHGTANVVHARQVYKRLLGYMEIKLLS